MEPFYRLYFFITNKLIMIDYVDFICTKIVELIIPLLTIRYIFDVLRSYLFKDL